MAVRSGRTVGRNFEWDPERHREPKERADGRQPTSELTLRHWPEPEHGHGRAGTRRTYVRSSEHAVTGGPPPQLMLLAQENEPTSQTREHH